MALTAALTATLGAILIAVGFYQWAPAAGFVVLGLELLAAAYAIAYLQARIKRGSQ